MRVEGRNVYLTACDYSSNNGDAEHLLEDQSFNLNELLTELARLASSCQPNRIHPSATRMLQCVVNTCFRRGYVLNVLGYRIAAGFAAVIPFGDQLPRYLARDAIRTAFGITDELHTYIKGHALNLDKSKLQTSQFEASVEFIDPTAAPVATGKVIGNVAASSAVVAGGFAESIIRVAAPAAKVLSGTARVGLTVGALAAGVVISAGIAAWAAVDSGKHIFSYVNRLCDDIIVVGDLLLLSILKRAEESQQ